MRRLLLIQPQRHLKMERTTKIRKTRKASKRMPSRRKKAGWVQSVTVW